MELTVKVIGRDIKTSTSNFTSYSLLTAYGNWYRTSKVKAEELAKVRDTVVTVVISRKFDKTVNTVNGEKNFPTLVIEEIKAPTAEQLAEYNGIVEEANKKTLVDIR